MMNVLILTGRFGMGHVAAAEAVQQEIVRRAPSARVDVVDIVEACRPELSGLVYGFFDFTVHYCSGVYNLLNRLAGRCGGAPLERQMRSRMERLLDEPRPDLVVSALPLSSQYVAAYKRASGDPIPLYTYITDIYAHNEWLAPETDCYFVGDESTRRQLLAEGVPGRRIVVSGIPVRQGFYARSTRPDGPRELLVMGGGLGLLPHAEELFSALAGDPSVHVTVLTGHNQSLAAKLRRHWPELEVVGYTDRVADYMARADLLLTKAGGSTTFEAIHAGVPLCLLRPFLMQEEDNAAYAERHGFGRVLRTKGREVEDLLDLLHDGEALADMRQRMAVALRTLDDETVLDRYQGEEEAVC